MRRLFACCLFVVAAAVQAQPFPEGPAAHHRTVGGWEVESAAEDDGVVVRMSRTRGDYALEYSLAYWRGNYSVPRASHASRGGTLCGGAPERVDYGVQLPAAQVRGELAEALAACGASEREAAAILRGFAPAYRLLSRWAAEAEAATAAEAAAIADYGRDPPATQAGEPH
ncbi:MAG TPA: hypothetical protein VGX37_05580 [Allosphingosinicella sp.]|nr:hypothetical protein [Allosphingosinicella sp.]